MQFVRRNKGLTLASSFLSLLILLEAVGQPAHTAQMHPYLLSPVYALTTAVIEDWAWYVVTFMAMLPAGLLLRREGEQFWLTCAGLIGAALVWEIVQPLLRVDYFRLYAVAAVALGLLTGGLCAEVLCWIEDRRAAQGALLLIGTVVTYALENAEVAGYSLYEAATMRFSGGMISVALLMLMMLAGKTVCFSALIQPLTKHSLAPWLCLPLLLLTMPKALLVQDAAVLPGWTIGYVLCAAALAFGMSDGAVLWKEKRLQEEKG